MHPEDLYSYFYYYYYIIIPIILITITLISIIIITIIVIILLSLLLLLLLLEKWFPLQGKRAQSLKLFNVRMLGFKNKIEMRKRRQNNNRPISIYHKVITFSTYYMYTTSPKTLYQKGIYNFQ